LKVLGLKATKNFVLINNEFRTAANQWVEKNIV
jgi:hypothetical protein